MKLKSILATAAALALTAGSASALTLGFAAWSDPGAVTAGKTGSNTAEITITGNAPLTGFQIFTTTDLTKIIFEDYEPDTIDGATTGLSIINLDTGTVLNDSGSGNYSNLFNFISAQEFAGCGSICDVSGITPAGTTVGVPDEGLTFSNLVAGTYLIGVQENGRPPFATLEFDISQVPLPAGAWLLLGGLGGLAAMKRRKKS